MKASDLMIKSLENEGVEFIFGIPGQESQVDRSTIDSQSINQRVR